MRISLIGESGAGKTTFLGALYARHQVFRTAHLIEDYELAEKYTAKKIHYQVGFCIDEVIFDSDRELLNAIAKDLRSRPIIYPDKTIFSEKMPIDVDFRCWSLGHEVDDTLYELGNIVDTLQKRIELVDLPGDAFNPNNTTDYSAELDLARTSDAIIAFISVEDLADPDGIDKVERLLLSTIPDAVDNISESKVFLPVSIVVSKCDFFEEDQLALLLEKFNEIVTQLSSIASRIVVMTCPTQISKNNTSRFNPKWIEYPFLFSGYGKIIADQVYEEKRHLEEKDSSTKATRGLNSAKAYKDRDWLGYYWDVIVGDQTSISKYRDRVDRHNSTARAAMGKAEDERRMAQAIMQSIALDIQEGRAHLSFSQDGDIVSASKVLKASSS